MVTVFVLLRSQASRGWETSELLSPTPTFLFSGTRDGCHMGPACLLSGPAALRMGPALQALAPCCEQWVPGPALTSHPRGPIQERLLLCPALALPVQAQSGRPSARGHDRGRLLRVLASSLGSHTHSGSAVPQGGSPGWRDLSQNILSLRCAIP
uniref:Uncharacterized protein n=1 Tax=Myotis myotis TaxID=51298 RepID=A0A7J7QUW6_MYOMY|nr:hypothetical protein mMyoMyo1_011552 [Myotis myotis]